MRNTLLDKEYCQPVNTGLNRLSQKLGLTLSLDISWQEIGKSIFQLNENQSYIIEASQR